MKVVNKAVRKIDSMALVTGKPVYTDDIAPPSCLIVKVLRSPHAFAKIREIDLSAAKRLPGIECVLTYKEVPKFRFTTAGQSYPELSPYDRLILDQYVRYVGDAVAIVAGSDERTVDRALKLIKVQYDVLEPVLDFKKALDHPSVIHPEDDYFYHVDIGCDQRRNLVAAEAFSFNDVDAVLNDCDIVIDREYHTKANAQAMMETFRTYTYFDHNERLNIVTSTQVPFHVRRIIARALNISRSAVRVIKPRIGGGFGAKQTIVSEIFPALVTFLTKKPAKIVFSRQETFASSNSRHEMCIRVRLGANKNGSIRAIEVDTLSNTGAYSEHGPTTVGLSGHKPIPLYNKASAFRFNYQVVYSNTMPAGAYRGYGATQGFFALETAVNELAESLGIDPVALREQNMVQVGEVMPAYYDETLLSSALDRCLIKGSELIGWRNRTALAHSGPAKARGLGMAMAMQGSGIAGVDTASVEIRLNDDGYYTLLIGATDMGTGCDTILAQIAAESLGCGLDKIIVQGVDTDSSPYDTGSYASCTTYVTGTAVIKACAELTDKIKAAGAKLIGLDREAVDFDGSRVYALDGDRQITINELAEKHVYGSDNVLSAGAAHCSPTSPPPFMTGFAEVEVDLETGKVDVVNYAGVVDCGTVINTNLARIQAEGGIVQGIGMALFEDVHHNENGKLMTDSFMQYKLPTRLDTGSIIVEFESSYEPSGPFGAKSIGEVVINTTSPAIVHAVYNATGVWIRDLPITPEKVLRGMGKLK